MKSLQTNLRKWNAQHDSFTKLQHGYAAIAVAALIVAGVISLINHALGQSILFIAMCALIISIGNGVVWAILRTFVLAEPEATSTTARSKPTKK